MNNTGKPTPAQTVITQDEYKQILYLLKHLDNTSLLDELKMRGIDARPITEFSMTELNNEITRRRMEAERAEINLAEEKIIDKSKPIIYLFCAKAIGLRYPDVIGYAVAEDGYALCSHLSSSVEFSKHDMGLTSDWKHDIYKKHYPDGYNLVWLDSFDNLPKEVLEKNKKLKKEKEGN